MYLKSLEIELAGRKIITDIDDCLFLTTKSINEHKIWIHKFWFDKHTYRKNKSSVFEKADLTEWGKEFVELVKNGFENYELITAGRNRLDILVKKLGIDGEKVRDFALKKRYLYKDLVN